MPNYRESSVTGTKYTRAFRVEFENPLGQPPSARFHEEEVALLSDGSTIKTACGSVSKTMTDPAESFPLIDPATGEATGQSMTLNDAYVMVTSLYYHLAAIRDAGQ